MNEKAQIVKKKLTRQIPDKDFCSVKSPFEKRKDKLHSEKVFVKYNPQRITL